MSASGGLRTLDLLPIPHSPPVTKSWRRHWLDITVGPHLTHEWHENAACCYRRSSVVGRLVCLLVMTASHRGVVVNFDLRERFPRPRSQQRGILRPRARRVAVLGMGAGGGRRLPLSPLLPLRGSGGVTSEIFFEIFDAKSRVWGQFGPENKLIEGQPNEYDMICRNASVLAFHLWPTIFAGAPFRLQNICRNGVPPRSRTTTALASQQKWLNRSRRRLRYRLGWTKATTF